MKFFSNFIFFLIFLSFSGCSFEPFRTQPVVSGVVVWRNTEANKYYSEDITTLYKSTKMALKELDCVIIEDKTERNSFYLKVGAEGAFTIKIYEINQQKNNIKIKVNLPANIPYADIIYNQIDINLNSIEYDNQGNPTKSKRSNFNWNKLHD